MMSDMTMMLIAVAMGIAIISLALLIRDT